MSSTTKVLPVAAVSPGMDKITGLNQTALDGIQAAHRKLHKAAHDIASAPAQGKEPVEIAAPLVDMIEAQRAIEASAAVMRRANDALDSVLDALRS